ncbi:MAG: ABC transporter substrate-binding protein [Neptuniibacter sp.]
MQPKTLFMAIIAGFTASTLSADTLHETYSPTQNRVLTINGAADYPEVKPLLEEFHKQYPEITVNYTEYSTKDLFLEVSSKQGTSADIVMSSAMDLQIKLVNDGLAQKFTSSETKSLPAWASWRNEIYGYSYEPATISINKTYFKNTSIPKSRADLLSSIRKRPEVFTGKIGTFDITRVGVGYLLWAYDSQQTGSYGRILESFGAHQVRMFPSSASMLSELASGQIGIAYNVLGSYSNSWAQAHPDIEVILPNDYTTVLMRSLFIPKSAKNSADARTFINYLLSEDGQKTLAEKSSLYPIREGLAEDGDVKSLRVSVRGPLRPIPLGLPLLVLNDKMKKELLYDEWERALIEWE